MTSNRPDGEGPLRLSIAPLFDTIGLQSADTATKICVNVKAKEMLDDHQENVRSPVDIVVALDVSGSMKGRKLEDCKKTLSLVARNLSSKDRLGLVTFGSSAKVVLPVSKMTQELKTKAIQLIESLQTDGMTNLSGGLALAAQELNEIAASHPVRSIFLLTDGHANMGVTGKENLAAMVKALNADMLNLHSTERMKSPTSLFAFGYGQNHDSDILRAMAEASPGGLLLLR